MWINRWRYLTWLWPLLSLALLANPSGLSAASSKQQSKPSPAGSCTKCHASLADVLPSTHQPVQKKELPACLQCHAPGGWGKLARSTFDTRLHLTHLADPASADCFHCHRWQPGSGLQLTGMPGKYGSFSKEEFATLRQMYVAASASRLLDNHHLRNGVTCWACHANGGLDQVSNAICLSCHGPLAALQEKTTPQQHADRNPHKSHLGEIDCIICHKQHAPQSVYCLECHPKFDLHLNGPASKDNGETGR